MARTILTLKQQLLLDFLAKQRNITHNFYLSDGTALSEYYLHHRYSEDLDFFSFDEVDPLAIQIILKTLDPQLNIKIIDFQQSFNRNLFFIHFSDKEVVKTEVTYYPFTQIEHPQLINKLKVDSLIDIAVNKAFTIYQMPRMRDFIDLYFIIKQENWTFLELLYKARSKFDSPIDPLQAAKQLLQINTLKDYPHMIKEISQTDLKSFWIDEIQRFKKEAII